jgi:hypothetical protein
MLVKVIRFTLKVCMPRLRVFVMFAASLCSVAQRSEAFEIDAQDDPGFTRDGSVRRYAFTRRSFHVCVACDAALISAVL